MCQKSNFFLAIICINFALLISDKPTRNVIITAEEEKIRDPEGYAAIKAVHLLLDDDQSGSIDRFESDNFLAEDLKFGGSERERREKSFHGDDDSITVDDLWETWFQSSEREWDQKQVVDWLVNTVKLPQYANNFLKNRVTGIHLPRMAVQNSTFLNSLGIKNYVHRQKMQLKALDLVLFGFQDSSSLLKDVALAGLLIILVTVLIVFKTHKNRSKRQMEELSSRLSKLRDMETDFEGVQKIEEDSSKKPSMDGTGSENVEMPPFMDQEQERRNVAADVNGFGYDGLPFSLQNLLRRTYEIESNFLNQQKLECLHEMREAKELVDKMRRKQTSIVNSLKLATGATSGTDDIDTKIFNLKTRMEKIKLSLEEERNRWAEIESICGFSITGPFGAHNANPVTQPQFNRSLAPQQIHSGFDGYANAHNQTGTAVHQQQLDYWNRPSFDNMNLQEQLLAQQTGQIRANPMSLQQFNAAEINGPQSSLDGGSLMGDSASVISSQTTGGTRKKGGNRLKQLFRIKPKH